MTPRRTHAFLDHPVPIPFVHRGGPTGLPENTIVAFDRAYQMGFRYFETDVHATTDGVLVAFHDRSLRRLTGERLPIASMTSDEVATVRIDGEPVPLLEELLSTFPDTRINIDPKDDGAVRPLVHTLLMRKALDRVCLASFSDVRLRWLRAAFGTRACTAAGPREIARARWSSRRGRRLDLPGVDVVQLPPGPSRWPLLDQRLLDAAHEAGIPVHVWTINEPHTMGRLLGLGVDGIMSDDARALRQVFRERGIWQPDTNN